jgi:ubiquinone/menaquinone biosynthesis C-methylase UbiE
LSALEKKTEVAEGSKDGESMSFESKTKRDLYWKELREDLKKITDPSTGLISEKFSQYCDCPLCSKNNYESLFQKNGFTFVRCIDCGLIYTNPQPLKEKIKKFYENSNAINLWMQVLQTDTEKEWRERYFLSNLMKIEDFIAKGKLLDVGCATGHFMMVAHERSWEVMGLELNSLAYEHVKNVLKLPVLQATLDQANFSTNEFDAVTLFGLLEHVLNPKELLKQAFKVVRSGGIIEVVVPNAYSLSTMILNKKSSTFNGYNHLIYFSSETLENLFKLCNLKVVYKDTLFSGISNIIRYFQFYDPYGPEKGNRFLPDIFNSLIQTDKSYQQIEDFIYKNNLGLRIRMLGQK